MTSAGIITAAISTAYCSFAYLLHGSLLKGKFVDGQNTSKYRDRARLKKYVRGNIFGASVYNILWYFDCLAAMMKSPWLRVVQGCSRDA